MPLLLGGVSCISNGFGYAFCLECLLPFARLMCTMSSCKRRMMISYGRWVLGPLGIPATALPRASTCCSCPYVLRVTHFVLVAWGVSYINNGFGCAFCLECLLPFARLMCTVASCKRRMMISYGRWVWGPLGILATALPRQSTCYNFNGMMSVSISVCVVYCVFHMLYSCLGRRCHLPP